MIAEQRAALFPGQGSQIEGMGRDLAETDKEAMQLWHKAEQYSGLALRDIYWGGTDQDMADTRALQPALTVVTLNLWLYAAKRGMTVQYMAGHSLGEYSALAAAKALSPEQTLELVSLRGRLMAEAGAGDEGMTALLKVTQDQAEEIVSKAQDASGQELLIANYNTPQQFVISGKKAALEQAATETKSYKGRAIPLPVSGAFHSPLMEEAARELAGQIRKADWKKPQVPVFSNETAAAAQDPAVLCKQMTRQMTSPVRWIALIHNQYTAGVRHWFEPGPKGVLTRMLAQILKEYETDWTASTLENMVDVDRAVTCS